MLISTQKANSADAKADIANGFGAEAFFELSQDVDLRNLLELVQNRLEQLDIEYAVAQCDGAQCAAIKLPKSSLSNPVRLVFLSS